MDWLEVIWTDENEAHIAEHGITPDEVEHVLTHRIATETSRTTGRPVAFGYTLVGRYLGVVYEEIDAVTVYPITAFEPE